MTLPSRCSKRGSNFSDQSSQETIEFARNRTAMSGKSPKHTSGYCIFTPTFFQGPVPSVFGENDKVCIFTTETEAQREIVDNALIRLQQFLDGERDFDDAISIEEYIVKVDVLPDGSIDSDGIHFS
jgi:hypothetical protein